MKIDKYNERENEYLIKRSLAKKKKNYSFFFFFRTASRQ